MANIKTIDEKDVLMKCHKQIFIEYLPVILFMFVFGVIGLIGNVITMLFYKSKSRTSTTIFILALTIVDFIVCVLTFTTVADLSVNVLFNNIVLCKTMYFLDQWMINSSVLILWNISIDRYMKICRRHGKQFTLRTAPRAVILLVLVALLLSVRAFFTYDVVTISLKDKDLNMTVEGKYCKVTDSPELPFVIFALHIVEIVAVSVIFVTFVFSYGSIGHELWKQRQKLKSHGAKNVKSGQSFTGNEGDSTSTNKTSCRKALCTKFDDNITSVSDTIEKTDSTGDHTVQHEIHKTAQVPKTKHKYTSLSKSSERRVTLLMLAVSIGLLICFTPYFIVRTGIRRFTSGAGVLKAWTQFAVRSPFWNSVINPLLFFVFNPRYRTFIKNVLKR